MIHYELFITSYSTYQLVPHWYHIYSASTSMYRLGMCQHKIQVCLAQLYWQNQAMQYICIIYIIYITKLFFYLSAFWA